MLKNWLQNGWTWVVVLVAIIIIIFSIKSCKSTNTSNEVMLINALNDSITTYKNSNGQLVTRIDAMQTASTKDFLQIQSKDSQITNLQKLVKQYSQQLTAGGSVTTTGILTQIDTTTKNKLVKSDTVHTQDNAIVVWSEFSDSVENKWLDLRTLTNKDSMSFHLKIYNEYSVIVGNDKGTPFVDVINNNPYSSVKSLRTYQVSLPPPKKFGIGIQSGIGFTNDLKLSPYIGIGVSYNFINF